MAKVNGAAGFTQLDKLNITDTLLIQGSPVISNSSANVVIVNSLADFPDPVGGVIDLTAGGTLSIVYQLASKEIDVSPNTFKSTGGEVVIIGTNRFQSNLTTDATGVMFDMDDTAWALELFSVDCVNADIFTHDAAGAGFLSIVHRNMIYRSCKSIGTVNGAFVTSLRTCTSVNTSVGGITWIGTNNSQINCTNFLGLGVSGAAEWTGNLLDLGTATFDLIVITSDNRFSSVAGNTILSGATNSANLKAGGRAIVDSSIFNGVGTPLNGITTNDISWDFSSSVIFTDGTTFPSRITTDAFLTASRTVTISTQGTYVAVAGTDWSSDVTHRFTVSTAGLITYIGLDPIDVEIICVSQVEKVGGGTNNICSKIAIDGTVLDKSVSCTDNATPTSITSIALVSITTGDTIQLFVANEDSTSNIIVSQSSCTIKRVM